MNALVSVILPVRNGEKYVKAAVESVLAQTYPHFELVVVDASDDNTPLIVKSFSDERIKYFRQQTKGSVNGYNEALDKYITGDYVTFIHHDDLYYPEKLYEQVRTIEKFSDVDCVYNDIEFVDNELNTLRIRGHEDYYHRGNDLLAVMMIGYGISNLGMNVLVKRDFIEKHHLRYSLETPVCCDHAYIFDLLDAGAVFKHIAKPLLRYRIHDENYSGDKNFVEQDNQRIYARYSLEKLEEIVKNSNYSEAEKQTISARLLYRLGHIEKGHEILKTAIENFGDPWMMFYLGTAYYRYQTDFENAKLYLQKGQELMPYRAEFYNNIGCCHAKTGEKIAASKFFKRSLDIDKSNDAAAFNLAHFNDDDFSPLINDRELIPDTLTANISFTKRWSYL
jgi:glycosyltransferase involved in cell wall biosynthesis